MNNMLKSRIAISMLLIFILVCGLLSACGSGGSGQDNQNHDASGGAQIETTDAAAESEKASSETHKIGVLVYNIADEEVMAFRNYLEEYIAQVFPDVQFLYSQSITSQEAEMAFIQSAADAGAEGIMSFLSYDLKAEECLFIDDSSINISVANQLGFLTLKKDFLFSKKKVRKLIEKANTD